MTRETKIAILGLGSGFLLFVLMQKTIFSKNGIFKKAAPPKKASQDDMQVAGSAYAEALANNEPSSTLAEMNESFGKQYGIQVMQKKSDGSIIITDMNGTELATYQPAA